MACEAVVRCKKITFGAGCRFDVKVNPSLLVDLIRQQYWYMYVYDIVVSLDN